MLTRLIQLLSWQLGPELSGDVLAFDKLNTSWHESKQPVAQSAEVPQVECDEEGNGCRAQQEGVCRVWEGNELGISWILEDE